MYTDLISAERYEVYDRFVFLTLLKPPIGGRVVEAVLTSGHASVTPDTTGLVALLACNENHEHPRRGSGHSEGSRRTDSYSVVGRTADSENGGSPIAEEARRYHHCCR